MTHPLARLAALALFAAVCWTAPLLAVTEEESKDEIKDLGESPVATLLGTLPEDVRVYNDHVVTLSNPFCEGRVPGSRGMEIASEYIEYYYRQAGLIPAFDKVDDQGNVIESRATFRQHFELAGKLMVEGGRLAYNGAAGATEMTLDQDFAVMGLGTAGKVTAPLTFVGYSIENGMEDYASYKEDDDLDGRIAVMLRFEPMDENGKSRWAESGWARSGLTTKLKAAAKRNAEAIILINTPGASDPRIEQPVKSGGSTRGGVDIPVVLMSPEAGEKMIRNLVPDTTLMDLRRRADEKGIVMDLNAEVTLETDLHEEPLVAFNIGGLLPGKGELEDELIIVGAHHDHLGMGEFGSRSGPGELHPGADDNASGTAAIMMMADRLVDAYEELPPGKPARSILFLAFSAEESGLNGSRYYVQNPLVPIEQHSLMINFDMIGRIANGRLSVSGKTTGKGFADWLSPFFEKTPLEIVAPESVMAASDHSSFMRRDIPVLFGIIADFHDDYHTPRDTSHKINRVSAVQTVDLFTEICYEAALLAEFFEFQDPPRPQRGNQQSARSAIKVRFGIRPNYDESSTGITIEAVTEGGSAAVAGLLAGDIMTTWNGEEIKDTRSWMQMLAKHAPGDVVKVGVERDGSEQVFPVKLQARDG